MALSKFRSKAYIELIGNECEEFHGCKLPTVRNVLSIFFYHVQVEHDVRQAAWKTVRKLNAFWDKTKIPRGKDVKQVQKIEKIYHEWRVVTRRLANLTDAAKAKHNNFVENLDKLFDASSKDAIAHMQGMQNRAKTPAEKQVWVGEISFLIDQRGPRIGTMLSVDGKMRKKEKQMSERESRREKRLLDLKERRQKDSVKRQKTGETLQFDDTSTEEDSEARVMTPEKPKRGRHNIMTSDVVEAIDAEKISNRSAAKILSATASSLGVSVKQINISKSTIHRTRENLRSEAAEDIKNTFHQTADAILTVHWDGKILPSLDGSSRSSVNDRQAIVVTGIHTNQFLGAPTVPNGTATAICSAVSETLKEWKIENNVKAMSFDTTNVNSGYKNGAAVKLEKELGKMMLWLPCRHHIFERVLEIVYRTLMGKSTGPEETLFKEFQDAWEKIDKSKFSNYKTYAASRNCLSESAKELLEFAKIQIETGQPRDDYLELLEVIILFLGGQPPRGVKFRKPGPTSNARWMAKAIYVVKMSLFRKQLNHSQTVADSLLQVTVFVIKVYAQVWFQAIDPVSAPRLDLEFLKNLLKYEAVNKKVAKAAFDRFSCHLWYLSEILVGLAVFDESLPDSERMAIVSGIMNRKGSDSVLIRRKKELNATDVPGIKLGDLSSEHTKRFFAILNIQTDFFHLPVSQWVSDSQYVNGKVIISHLKVVNDHAERAVKLMGDFNRGLTKKETSFQNLLLTVEAHRKTVPDDTKNTLVKKYEK